MEHLKAGFHEILEQGLAAGLPHGTEDERIEALWAWARERKPELTFALPHDRGAPDAFGGPGVMYVSEQALLNSDYDYVSETWRVRFLAEIRQDRKSVV